MRDWEKVRSYVKGQQNRELRRRVEVERLEFPQEREVGFGDALEYLKQSQRDFRRRLPAVNTPPGVRSKPSGTQCREIEITVNLDLPVPNGFPSVSVSPPEILHLAKEFYVRVKACKNGEKQELCNLQFSL